MTEDGANYPEGLTPGERRVLDYVREGTLDAEIGVRLGIPVGEVKDRIGRIVHKLGVRDRRDLVRMANQEPAPGAPAAAWSWARPGSEVIDFTPDEGAAAVEDSGPVIDFTPTPFRVTPSKRHGRRLVLAAAAVALLLVAGAVAVFIAVTNSGGPAPPGATPPAESRTPGIAATSAAAGTTRAVLISEVAVKDMPPNTVLYVETGCTNCDLGPTSLVRVWARSNGEYEVKTLFTPPTGADGKAMPITAIASGPGGRAMVIGVCSGGTCQAGFRSTADARTTIYQTADGGLTWSVAADLKGGWEPVLVTGQTPGLTYVMYGDVANIGRQGVEMPGGATIYRGGDVRYGPFSIGLWQSTDGRIAEADGKRVGRGEVIDFAAGWVELAQNGHWVAIGDSSMLMLQDPVSGAGDRDYGLNSAGLRRADMGTRRILAVGRPEHRLDPNYFFANVVPDVPQPQFRAQIFNAITYGTSPAFINVEARTIFFIAKPFIDMPPGRNRILASATGRFVRVHDTGDCLNIRREPTAISPILDCVFDGALLKLRAVPGPAAGYTAISYGPADAAAWVTSAYVED